MDIWQHFPESFQLEDRLDKSKWPEPETHFDNAGPQLSGFNRPTRYEGEFNNLEVYGKIPKEISGTYFRIMPEPYHVPFIKNDIWLNGDGAVSSFRIKDGKVDFKQRFVRTEKFRVEALHNRALIGKYRNPWTDLVDFVSRTTANTTVIPWKNVVLALKEDSKPYALDPRTLETLGPWDFDGQLQSETFSAHPKYDVVTRELLSFGYEGKGIGTRDFFYMSINEHGKFTESVWFEAPFCSFQHEMVMTENYVIFPLTPMEYMQDLVENGGNHWTFNPERNQYIGIAPRRGAKSDDIKWYKGPLLRFTGHIANAWEQDGKIHLNLTMAKGNGFGFFPDREGNAPALGAVATMLYEYVIDPKAEDLTLPEPRCLIDGGENEFPRVDDRLMGRKSRYTFGNFMDMTPGTTDWAYCVHKIGGGIAHLNTLYKYDNVTGKLEKYRRGNRHFFQEPQFIPRHEDAPEGDGYLVALVNNFDEMTSELVIIDCNNFESHVALAKLPVRLRPGFHGSWVDDIDIDGRPAPAPASEAL